MKNKILGTQIGYSTPKFFLLLISIGLLYIAGCGGGSAGTTNNVPPLQSKTATVTGKIYYRDPDNVYPGEISLGEAIDAVTLKIASTTINSNNTGEFTFSNVASGLQTIAIEKKGYITMGVSATFQNGQNYVFNVGLYKEPETVKTQSKNFIKGVVTWEAGGWVNDYFYPKKLFQATYSRINEKVGANMVSVPDPVFIKTVNKNAVTMGTESNVSNSWHMLNEVEYAALVSDARNKNLNFAMWLGVLDDGKISSTDQTVYREVVAKGHLSNEFWSSWFSEYKKYVKTYATIARKLKINYLVLGSELGYATNKNNFAATSPDDCMSHWRDLIKAVRDEEDGAGYKGELIYVGGVSPHGESPYYEDAYYPDGFTELFDKVGIMVQDVHDDYSPSLNDLKGSFKKLFARCADSKRPVLILLRTPSVDGGTSFSTYVEPMLSKNKNANSRQRNLYQQADIYEAFFETLNNTEKTSNIAGVLSWGYHYLDDYLATPGKEPNQKMAMDKSANLRGKPAEFVLKYWFSKL